jgi:hypothetical protein
MREITIRIQDDLLNFIDEQAEGDRDKYVTALLGQYRRWSIQQEMIRSLQADCNDPEYRAEIALWDCVIGDGLDAAG